MAKNGVEGTYFKASGDSIEMFGAALGRFGAQSWVLDNFIQVDPDTVAHKIESVIIADRKAGQDGRIAHVLVNPRLFNVLYMEGRVPFEKMTEAIENEEEVSVTVPGIKFLDGEFSVKVMPSELMLQRYETEVSFATIDEQGDIV